MKRRGWGSWVVLMLGTAVLTLVALEGYLRVTQPDVELIDAGEGPGVSPASSPGAGPARPGSRAMVRHRLQASRDVEIRINGLGFRGPELGPRKRGEFRILVLGDSITYAAIIPEEETFVARLGRSLDEIVPERSITTINAGVVNIGLQQEVDLLEERGLAAKPDLVLIAFYLNDSRPPWGFGRQLGEKGWLRRHSRLADTVYTNLLFRRWLAAGGSEALSWVEASQTLSWASDPAAFRELCRLAGHDWGAAWREETWSSIRQQLERVKGLSEKQGFQVAVAAFPVRFQVEAEFLEDEPQRRLREQAEALGFPFLDLLPALRRARKAPLFRDQCHLTVQGHGVAAEQLREWLEPVVRGLVSPPAGVH